MLTFALWVVNVLLDTDSTDTEMQNKPREAVNMGKNKETGRIFVGSCCSAHFLDFIFIFFLRSNNDAPVFAGGYVGWYLFLFCPFVQ